MATSHYSRLEPHHPLTKDGYILALFKYKISETGDTDTDTKTDKTEKGSRPPIFFLHGMFCAGNEWVCHTDPEHSLPSILTRAGYDCFLGCLRGSRLNTRSKSSSKVHIKYTKKQKKYWDFSVDEFGRYDVPAMINYILDLTGHDSLFCIGHSLGACSILLTLSSIPEFNEKVKLCVALSPAVYGDHCRNFWLNHVSAPVFTLMGKSRFLYRRGVMQSSVYEMVKNLTPCIPKKKTVTKKIYKFYTLRILKITCPEQTDKKQVPILYSTVPGGSSLKMVCHVMQCLDSKKMQAYDYGRQKNMKAYGKVEPPEYDIANVTAPVALFTTKWDYLVGEEDVKRLYKELPNAVFYKSVQEKFYHMDFMVGKDADKLVYQDVLELLDKYAKKKLDDDQGEIMVKAEEGEKKEDEDKNQDIIKGENEIVESGSQIEGNELLSKIN